MHNKYVILNLTYFSLSLKFFGCPFCFGDEARISLPGLSCCFNSLNCICMRVFGLSKAILLCIWLHVIATFTAFSPP